MSRIEELEKQIAELDERKVALQHELEREKQKTEIEYPFEYNESYWLLDSKGEILHSCWYQDNIDTARCEIGNAFFTVEAAQKERDKLSLLTRFRQFRDKSNGDWKPDFNDDDSWKYCIAFNHNHNMLKIYSYLNIEEFHLFGYFRKESDAERAIELFGDEIKRLFVEE